MDASTPTMTAAVLATLHAAARRRGWTDAQWAAAAGVRHETLSRVLRRGHCDTATIEALAAACGQILHVRDREAVETSASGHWPQAFDRAAEERILTLIDSGELDPAAWRAVGPAFFMAGVAFMLATQDDFDRMRLSSLAEQLHPGIGSHDAFRYWLRETPTKPYRVLPMLRTRRKVAARDRQHA